MMTYEDYISDAKSRLAEAADLIGREISAYPTPIAGCDDQFNKLLEERSKVHGAIEALRETVFIPTPHS